MTGRARRLTDSSAVHMAVAFFAMGGWAILANRNHALPRMLSAGVIQGTLSAMITLFLKSAVERLRLLFAGASRLWAPPFIALAVSATLLLTVHTIAGTPEVAHTVAVPLLVSSGYAALYSYALYRRENPAP